MGDGRQRLAIKILTSDLTLQIAERLPPTFSAEGTGRVSPQAKKIFTPPALLNACPVQFFEEEERSLPRLPNLSSLPNLSGKMRAISNCSPI
jgi:hypothetical protein